LTHALHMVDTSITHVTLFLKKYCLVGEMS